MNTFFFGAFFFLLLLFPFSAILVRGLFFSHGGQWLFETESRRDELEGRWCLWSMTTSLRRNFGGGSLDIRIGQYKLSEDPVTPKQPLSRLQGVLKSAKGWHHDVKISDGCH